MIFLVVVTPTTFFILDRLFPLPLNEVKMARIVVSDDETPLWRFADKNGVWRYPVTKEDVSPYYIEALLTYEDRYFYKHFGVNPASLVRAFFQNLVSGKIVSGASTLSMQTARLIEPHERNISGKLRQIFRTFQLEWHLNKDEILTLYLNKAPFGGTIEGIGAASWTYLGKAPSELSHAESALMVALPQAPSRLRPDRFPQKAGNARDKVLDRLSTFNVWDAKVVKEAKEEDIYLPPRFTPQLAPLFARRVLSLTDERVIKTTINAPLQQTLEEMALNWKNSLFSGTSLAILVIDHTDMSIKAYVGSIDFNDDARFGHVDMIAATRSPGSTLKPFIYALGIDEGLIHSESLLQDAPRQIGDYRPSNFNMAFNGPVSTSESLLKSLNLPAVQLLEVYGPKKFTSKLSGANVNLKFPTYSQPNLSLILGGVGVRFDELVSGYSAFAKGGDIYKPRFLQSDPLVSYPFVGDGAAWITRRILSGEANPDFYRSGFLSLAYKTGTSYGFRDAFAVGISSKYLIGIWVGRPDGTPVANQMGSLSAVPFLYQVNNLLQSKQTSSFLYNEALDAKPDSVSSETICWPTSTKMNKADENCRVNRKAWIYKNQIPPTLLLPEQDFMLGGWYTYFIDKKGEMVASDCEGATIKKLALWPISLNSWLAANERLSSRLPKKSKTCPPLENSELVRPLLITDIKSGTILKQPNNEDVLMPTISSQGGLGKRWWFLNGELVATNYEHQRLNYKFQKDGKFQLLIMDESGQSDKVDFIVENVSKFIIE
ncbi:MAG: penicillin-binding protein 1C [Campylobacteraceae bacterium]